MCRVAILHSQRLLLFQTRHQAASIPYGFPVSWEHVVFGLPLQSSAGNHEPLQLMVDLSQFPRKSNRQPISRNTRKRKTLADGVQSVNSVTSSWNSAWFPRDTCRWLPKVRRRILPLHFKTSVARKNTIAVTEQTRSNRTKQQKSLFYFHRQSWLARIIWVCSTA